VLEGSKEALNMAGEEMTPEEVAQCELRSIAVLEMCNISPDQDLFPALVNMVEDQKEPQAIRQMAIMGCDGFSETEKYLLKWLKDPALRDTSELMTQLIRYKKMEAIETYKCGLNDGTYPILFVLYVWVINELGGEAGFQALADGLKQVKEPFRRQEIIKALQEVNTKTQGH
jgi:hypothetical protein